MYTPHFLYSLICQWTLRLFLNLDFLSSAACGSTVICLRSWLKFFWISTWNVILLDHKVVLFFSFWDTFVLCSILATPFCIFTNDEMSFPQKDRCEIISQCDLICLSMMISDVEQFFIFTDHLFVWSLENMFIQILFPVLIGLLVFVFFNWVVRVCYIFCKPTPYQIYGVQIYTPTVLLSTLLIVSFAMQKRFSLI